MDKYNSISPRLMYTLVLLPSVLAIFLFMFAEYIYSLNSLSLTQYIIYLNILAIIVIGGYQIFFWVQNNNYVRKARCLKIFLDDYIPFIPKWVWIYSVLYYILIGLTVLALSSIENGIYLIFGGVLILVIHCIVFYIFPVQVPPYFREYQVNSLSCKLLRLIQKLDNGRNCFPSMHCSITTYAGLSLVPILGIYSYVIMFIICISCLFVKQHQILDIPSGILVGVCVFYFISVI